MKYAYTKNKIKLKVYRKHLSDHITKEKKYWYRENRGIVPPENIHTNGVNKVVTFDKRHKSHQKNVINFCAGEFRWSHGTNSQIEIVKVLRRIWNLKL